VAFLRFEVVAFLRCVLRDGGGQTLVLDAPPVVV
jgi:hypothetical protein